jgi:23S rRNA pseudouridine2605 synthase
MAQIRRTSKKKVSRRGNSGARPPRGTSWKKGTSKKKGTRRKVTGRRTITSREGGERLNKVLADFGIASRRAADELILGGHVWVDGVRVEELGLRVDIDSQEVDVDGERLVSTNKKSRRYYLLNKPGGVVCTNERRETRPRAVDLITDRDKGRIYTVGRLDEASKGLVLLTNDGDFANRIMHPRYGVAKTYRVKLRGRITDAKVQKVREGVHLAEGRMGSTRVVIQKRSRDYSHLLVTLYEGKNREIRRVFHDVGYEVVDLRRVSIGTLDDRGLKIGFWRPLTRVEVSELLDLSAGEEDSGADEKPAAASGPGRKKTTRRKAGTRGYGGKTRRGSGR